MRGSKTSRDRREASFEKAVAQLEAAGGRATIKPKMYLRLDDVIARLQQLRAEHGNLEVKWAAAQCLWPVMNPEVEVADGQPCVVLNALGAGARVSSSASLIRR